MPTKKDFQATADILHAQVKDSLVRVDGKAIPGLMLQEEKHITTYTVVRRIAGEFADIYEQANPAFRRDLFFQAVFH